MASYPTPAGVEYRRMIAGELYAPSDPELGGGAHVGPRPGVPVQPHSPDPA